MDIDKAVEIINDIETDTTTGNDNQVNNDNDHVASNQVNNPTSNQETNTNTPKNNRYNGTKNLVPFNKLTEAEQKELARQGGIKSGETRRKRKTARELLEKMLASNLTESQVEEILGTAASMLAGDNTVYNVMLAKMAQQAMAGDTKAFIALRDTAGDKPVDQTLTITDTMTDQDRKQIDKMRQQLMDISKIG